MARKWGRSGWENGVRRMREWDRSGVTEWGEIVGRFGCKSDMRVFGMKNEKCVTELGVG